MTEVASPASVPQTEASAPAPSSGGPTTIFHSADNFTVKHPLMHRWTLWFTRPPSGQKGENWGDLLKEVIEFDSVEEFWGIFNNIQKTSELAPKSDFHLFKKGIKPEWEDKQNAKGGKWAYQFKSPRNKKEMDDLWLFTMLAAIGETLEDPGDNEVMGVVVNVRRGFYRIGLWTRTTNNRDALMKIGARFKEVLDLPEGEKVEFNSHTDSAHSGSTRAKTKMAV